MKEGREESDHGHFPGVGQVWRLRGAPAPAAPKVETPCDGGEAVPGDGLSLVYWFIWKNQSRSKTRRCAAMLSSGVKAAT